METISVEEAYSDSIERERFTLEKMKNVDERIYWVLGFRGINSDFFLYSLFIENNVQKSKNYLYKLGMVNAYYHEVLKRDIYSILNTFTFPILSDSSKLIERYLNYSKAEYYDWFTTHFAKGLQSILKDDMPALEKHIDGLQRRSKRGETKQYVGIITSFDGFLNNNQEQIIAGIYELLKTHNKQDLMSLEKKYINFVATAIAKVAWRIGMEIEIDNPLVPKALLPVRELEHYEGYDFFKELEQK